MVRCCSPISLWSIYNPLRLVRGWNSLKEKALKCGLKEKELKLDATKLEAKSSISKEI